MAWYQRSYLNFFLILLNLILFRFFFTYLFIVFFDSSSVSCASFKNIKDISDYALKEISHKGITIKCSNIITETEAKAAIDHFILNKNLMNNFNICRYYMNKNNFLTSFDKYSSYSHPNFYFGSFENVHFNFQFTHKNCNSMFNNFSNTDLVGNRKNQFISKYMYLYHNSLTNLYLNIDSLHLNKDYFNLNEILNDVDLLNSGKIQNFIDNNNPKLKILKNGV